MTYCYSSPVPKVRSGELRSVSMSACFFSSETRHTNAQMLHKTTGHKPYVTNLIENVVQLNTPFCKDVTMYMTIPTAHTNVISLGHFVDTFLIFLLRYISIKRSVHPPILSTRETSNQNTITEAHRATEYPPCPFRQSIVSVFDRHCVCSSMRLRSSPANSSSRVFSISCCSRARFLSPHSWGITQMLQNGIHQSRDRCPKTRLCLGTPLAPTVQQGLCPA